MRVLKHKHADFSPAARRFVSFLHPAVKEKCRNKPAHRPMAAMCSVKVQAPPLSRLIPLTPAGPLSDASLCFPPLLKKSRRRRTHLDQSHLGAEGQEDFLRLGWVGVVSVLVEPLFEGPRHVLQGLALVSHFASAGATAGHEQGHDVIRQDENINIYTNLKFCSLKIYIFKHMICSNSPSSNKTFSEEFRLKPVASFQAESNVEQLDVV